MYFQPLPHAFAEIPADPSRWPAVVVGAGPVGLAAALGLARRGVRVLVLESGSTASYGSRAICISRNSLQILDRLGVGATLVDAALPWTGGRSFYRDEQVLHFQMPAAEEHARPPMVNISQSVAEQILIDAVEQQPGIALHWECRVGGVRHQEHGVVLDVETPEGPRTVHADWVVAADGARSVVRDSLGLTMSGTSYEGRYVIADIHWPSDWPTERRVWFDPPSNPGATIIMHRQPDDIWRIDYQLQPGDNAEYEVSDDRVRERISRHLDWVGTTVPWQIEWISLYRAHALSLESYREGRVLFAGDSAHLVPIFGVRGLNSGFEDADDLAWKLPLVMSGAAAPELLNAYSLERRTAWEQNIAFAAKSTLFMTPGSHGYTATREAALSLVAADASDSAVFAHLINPRQSSATHARRSPLTVPAAGGASDVLPGDVIDDRRVRVWRDGEWVTDTLRSVTGDGFAVLGVGVEPSVVAEAAAAGRELLGGVIGVVGVLAGDSVPDEPGGSVRLVEGDPSLRDAAGAEQGDLLVLRPDGRILARVRSVAAVREALEGVLRGGQLSDGQRGASAAVPDPVSADPAVARVEEVWQRLSELIDGVPAERREQAMLRVAMQLAVAQDDGETLRQACKVARDAVNDG